MIGKHHFLIAVVLIVQSLYLSAQSYLGNIENPQEGALLSIALHPNGQQMLTTGSDGRTNLWNLENYKRVKAFGGHTGKINASAYSADGRRFVTGGSDNTLILWDNETHKPLKILRGHKDEVICVAFNPMNNEIASGSADNAVIIWDVNGKAKFTLTGHYKKINSISFSADGKFLAAAASTDELNIYNTINGAEIKKITTEGDRKALITLVAFSDDGKHLAYSAEDKSVRLLDITHYKQVGRADLNASAASLAFSPDGQYLLIGPKNEKAVLWDLKNLTGLDNISSVFFAAFSNRGDKLIAADSEKITVWDVKNLGIRGKAMPVAQEEPAPMTMRGVGVSPTSLEEMNIGKYYALIIGIDNYRGEWTRLNNAVSDAKAVEQALKENYMFDHFITLFNEEATRSNITKKLEWLVDNVQKDDNVLIYYSGHGDFKQQLNKGYWVPYDALTKSTSDYISNSNIQDFLNGIASKHTLLIADACFSGDIFRGSVESVPFDNTEKYYKRVYKLMSRQAITSGGVEPVMDGGRDGHSVFAYYLLKALKGNQEKYLDAGQLYSRVNVPIVNNSNQSPIFSPVKDTGDEGGQFIFIRK